MGLQQDHVNADAPRRQRKSVSTDFRVAFAQMADDALIDRSELAALLATTPNAISMLAFKGQLPPKAFPVWRRAVWFAGDIRKWLQDAMASRIAPHPELAQVSQAAPKAESPRIGRPRKNS